MDDRNDVDERTIYKDVTDGEKTITIIAESIGDASNEWTLSIQGKGSQFNTWTELFSSSEDAMKEGVSEFYSDPEFEGYLRALTGITRR